MSDKTPTINISADLDQHEAEFLCELLRACVVKNRQMARFEHACGEMTDAELKWHLRHADWVDTVAEKLFPGWE